MQMGGKLQCKWEAYCDTNGRSIECISFSLRAQGTESTAIQIGGVLRYKLGMYYPGRNYYKIIPQNNCSCNNLCNYYNNNSTRAFSLQCCCHWFVPVCKRTCKGICFVKRLFCIFFTKLTLPKQFFLKSIFVTIF